MKLCKLIITLKHELAFAPAKRGANLAHYLKKYRFGIASTLIYNIFYHKTYKNLISYRRKIINPWRNVETAKISETAASSGL
jgi:hypothetical protein